MAMQRVSAHQAVSGGSSVVWIWNHQRSASYVDRVRAVTTDDVLIAARKCIRPRNMQVVLNAALWWLN